MGSRRYQIQAHLTEVRAAQYGQADLVMRGHQGEPARDNMALRAQLVVVREGVLADRRVDHQPRPQVTVAHDAAEGSQVEPFGGLSASKIAKRFHLARGDPGQLVPFPV